MDPNFEGGIGVDRSANWPATCGLAPRKPGAAGEKSVSGRLRSGEARALQGLAPYCPIDEEGGVCPSE
jgi:hypothetical protein